MFNVHKLGDTNGPFRTIRTQLHTNMTCFPCAYRLAVCAVDDRIPDHQKKNEKKYNFTSPPPPPPRGFDVNNPVFPYETRKIMFENRHWDDLRLGKRPAE